MVDSLLKEGRRIPAKPRTLDAFTLLEVMIASGIFFMAIFAILSLVTSNIRNAHLLQEQPLDPSIKLADLCGPTNILVEGTDSGDFGDAFPGCRWASDIRQIDTNGLWLVQVTVTKPGGGPRADNTVTTRVFSPNSPPGAAFAP